MAVFRYKIERSIQVLNILFATLMLLRAGFMMVVCVARNLNFATAGVACVIYGASFLRGYEAYIDFFNTMATERKNVQTYLCDKYMNNEPAKEYFSRHLFCKHLYTSKVYPFTISRAMTSFCISEVPSPMVHNFESL